MTVSKVIVVLAVLSGVRFARATPQNITSELTFDYIVVGAGPGRVTVASRLSENASVSVAVIEAGTWSTAETGNQSQVPAYDYHYIEKALNDTSPAADWGFITTPQAGINGEAVHYARGKSLGGCTDLNYMCYTQTTAGALQKWADTVGDQSYAYEPSSYYYRKSMNFSAGNQELRLSNATTSEAPGTAATGGPLDVTYSSFAQPFSTWVAKAMTALGIYSTVAFINGQLNGSSWLMVTINPSTGHRESAATAYLAPMTDRPNLKVFDLTLAERIIFTNDQVARGVEVMTNNQTYTLNARREIIVSAGAFQTPQLLMVSGIGPADILLQHNITVVADRPRVGQNMSDNIFFGITYRVGVTTSLALSYGDAGAQAVASFNTNGTGPLASPGTVFQV
ncbi:FAD/NAD(P)-binding domain-containing protein [Aspergillus ellipticus CBS 707.79]|uniref:FAD/NAD(P)-binding domain-containing protein n=1 Tax=Aspergillus ellipticus CBS 707.79 TaxID=1448320 RepID=A0A319DBN9_9EURO|nr:FAD/NAD(P)-binding domain-containing protein [Aspergillus ellipticus CBS 707.79]